MRRCIIVGGAEIKEYDRIRSYFKEDDYFIYCDCGLNHVAHLKQKPDLIVGDFDSYQAGTRDTVNALCEEREHIQETVDEAFLMSKFPGAEIITLPREKDDTDTVFASKEALRRGFKEFIIIGVIGGRLDHSIGNLGLLLMLHKAKTKALLIDDLSEMEIIDSKKPAIIPDRYKCFSILSVFGPARGVTITGSKFPTNRASFNPDYQYGISNETRQGANGCITIEEGKMLLVKVV